MSQPSTKTLDHIVHLTPPGTMEETSKQFKDLGFTVVPGGKHTGGFTENCLVVFQDGVYLELISFTHPASHYPPGSPERRERESIPWASKSPGWIDYAFLGSSTTSICHIINERARQDGSGAEYLPEQKGGRQRPDGNELVWVISAPRSGLVRGVVPFFCGDVTPRKWRVPLEPPSNTQHPSTAMGIAHVRILADEAAIATLSKQLTSVVGSEPVTSTPTESVWILEAQTQMASGVIRYGKPELILTTPKDDEERQKLKKNGPGIYEVRFRVVKGSGSEYTPYGKIIWSPD